MDEKLLFKTSSLKLSVLLAMGKNDIANEADDSAQGLALSVFLDKRPLEMHVDVDGLQKEIMTKLIRLVSDDMNSMDKIIFSTDTTVEMFTLIKEYYKIMIAEGDDAVAQEVMFTLYYSAISAALVIHQAKITQLGNAQVASVLTELIKEDWLPLSFLTLFIKARMLLQGG